MSFILNALQKSEAERREREQAPDLLAVQSPPTPQSAKRTLPNLWPLLSVLLLCSALALGYKLFLQRSAPVPVASSQPIDTNSNTGTDKPSKGAAAITPAIEKPSADTQRADQSDSEIQQQRISAIDQTPVASAAEIKSSAKPASNEQVIDLYQQPSDSGAESQPHQAPTLTDQQQALAERAQQVKREMAEPPVPAIHNLPIALQNRLPKMVYSAHIYSSDADSGFAIINDRRRYRGDQIAPGLLVVSVISTGVVLTFEGYTFRLDAMKNWPLE